MRTQARVVQAALFTHSRSDGADIVVTGAEGTTRLKRELVTYEAVGALERDVKIPSLSSVVNTELYVYYGNPARQRPTMPTPGAPTTPSSTT